MAGIGFELRRLFKPQSIFSKARGIVYATLVTVGPIIFFVFMLLLSNFVLEYFNVSYSDRLFFSTASLMVFIAAIIISSCVSTNLSRYISDKIYEDKIEDISSSIYGVIGLVTIISSVVGLAYAIPLYFIYNIDLTFIIGLYLLMDIASITYAFMVYISAVKEYKKVSAAFLIGIVFGIIGFAFGVYVCGASIINSLLYSFVITFFVINVLVFATLQQFFSEGQNSTLEFIYYYKRFPFLLLSAIFYIFGLYIHNFVFWVFSDMSIKVTMFKVLPTYDMATFLAMLINLSAVVIFTVKVETQFYEKYQTYCNAINSGSYSIIEKSRKNMEMTLNSELFFIYEVQLIITIVLICVGTIVLPMLGFAGMILDFFMILAIAFYCIFCMYFTVVFLYYFDDQKGACLVTGVFFFVTLGTSLFSVKLGSQYYPMGVLCGAVVSWALAFVRVKYYIREINYKMFC